MLGDFDRQYRPGELRVRQQQVDQRKRASRRESIPDATDDTNREAFAAHAEETRDQWCAQIAHTDGVETV